MDDEVTEESLALDAFSLTHGARQDHYGPPWEDHTRVAVILDAWFDGEFTVDTAVDVQLMLMAVKMARIGHAYTNSLPFDMWRDHLVDLIGYADCLWRTVQYLNEEGDDGDGGSDPEPEPEPDPEPIDLTTP